MLSTIEKDLRPVNGIMKIVSKEYPNWYGIEDIGFIWHGSWSDPEIEYNGNVVNSTIIEDTMWDRWTHDDYGEYLLEKANDEDGFAQYMRDNVDDVYELIELTMEGMR